MYTGNVYIRQPHEAFHPSCPLRRAWNTVMAVTMAWVLVVAPLDAAFDVKLAFIQGMDYFVTCVYFSDILITFFTGQRAGACVWRPLHTIYGHIWATNLETSVFCIMFYERAAHNKLKTRWCHSPPVIMVTNLIYKKNDTWILYRFFLILRVKKLWVEWPNLYSS